MNTRVYEDGVAEIRSAMRFYKRRGWSWFGVVEYLCWRAQRG